MKKMLRELVITSIILLVHCIVAQKDCVGVLTRDFDAIIEPPLCSSNNNNNNNNNNNISVFWLLSYWNVTLYYGIQSRYGSVTSNGSLIITGSENSRLDSSSVTASVYDGHVLCNTSDFTIKLLFLYPFSGLHVEHPLQKSNTFTIKLAGEPFILCLSANTVGLSTNEALTYWIRSSDRYKIYHESLSITNCTNCSCFINELEMREGGEERIQSFLVLYRTDPCYAVPNKLMSVLYISTTQLMDNGSDYSFHYTNIDGLKLPLKEGHLFRLSVEDQLMIDPMISVSPLKLTLSYEDTNSTVLCNGTTSVGEILEWKSPDNETVKWCKSNDSCTCRGNESDTYQVLTNKQIVPLSSSNSSSVLHTSVELIICRPTANSNNTLIRYYCTLLKGSTHKSVLVSYIDRPTQETPSSSSSNNPTSHTVLYTLLAISVLLPLLALLICTAIVCIFCLRKAETKREEMVQVLGGRVSLCSPTLYMKQQSMLHADPLEFPREMLHFQNIIGEGQFGQVWKAQAVGIVPEDPSLNIVAVKTLKSDSDFIDKEELLAELEIMKNLYPHPNILNLLGHCTVGGPCYIIMEFAMYGNLRDFLRSLKNTQSSSQSILAPSESSRNQLIARNEGEPVDPWSLYYNIPIQHNTVMKQHLINTDYYNQHNSGIEDTQMINTDTQIINTATQMIDTDTDMIDTDTDMIDTDSDMIHTDTDMIDTDTDMINTDSDIINTDTDMTAVRSLLTEKDIFNFSLQISRGMEHLQSQKCIHRDLAARNVLIAEGQILKIADFGLAKELSSKDYYRRLSSVKLPARWMGIESLDERQTHSHQSDVWSFGVVLWEIYNYGDTPYKDHDIGNTLESLLQFIKNGNRLKRPENCSTDMYQLMLQCWNDDPQLRPTFNELVDKFDKLLSLAHGYLQMTSEN